MTTITPEFMTAVEHDPEELFKPAAHKYLREAMNDFRLDIAKALAFAYSEAVARNVEQEIRLDMMNQALQIVEMIGSFDTLLTLLQEHEGNPFTPDGIKTLKIILCDIFQKIYEREQSVRRLCRTVAEDIIEKCGSTIQ
jgi:hypothetical protein